MEAINNHKLFFQSPLGSHPWLLLPCSNGGRGRGWEGA